MSALPGGVLALVSGSNDGQEKLVGEVKASLVGELTGDDGQDARIEAVQKPTLAKDKAPVSRKSAESAKVHGGSFVPLLLASSLIM